MVVDEHISSKAIIVHSNAVENALISAKNKIIRKFKSYNTKNTRCRFDKVIRVGIK